MVKSMSYTTISQVIETWDTARRLPGFDEQVGVSALLKLFELEPLTKQVFHIAVDHMPTAEELKESGNLQHAISMFQMFDAALNMLGPDTETLAEILNELGKRHIRYGVSAHYFPFMKHALFHALRESLGDKWTPSVEEAWTEVYEELSGAIMLSILSG